MIDGLDVQAKLTGRLCVEREDLRMIEVTGTGGSGLYGWADGWRTKGIVGEAEIDDSPCTVGKELDSV